MIATTRETRFEIEAVLVKQSAMSKIGTDEDIDPDLDATYVVETRATETDARKCAEQMFKKYEKRLMWNCVTIQQEVFGDDEGMPVWDAIGEMKGYYGDRWEE